jgi:hypothetical protein
VPQQKSASSGRALAESEARSREAGRFRDKRIYEKYELVDVFLPQEGVVESAVPIVELSMYPF